MAGARKDTGALGAGCSVPGWSKSISDVPDGVRVGAFWSLWDSVGDLNPETKQAAREAVVAGKRDAQKAATPTTIICRVPVQGGSMALAHRDGQTFLIVATEKATTEIPIETPTASINTDGTAEFSFTVIMP